MNNHTLLTGGERCGNLEVLTFLRRDRHGAQIYRCRCVCGEIVERYKSHLLKRPNQSCGCLLSTLRKRHGHAIRGNMSAEYRAYMAARQRCTNPKNPAYQRYGGRGIKFRFETFEDWYRAVGPRPSPQHSVDRINNDGHYEVGNLKWSTKSEQNANQRRSTKNR